MSLEHAAKRILIVKGHPVVLDQHAEEAAAFYSMLAESGSSRGFMPSFHSALEPLEVVADAAWLMAHSWGARALMASYSPAKCPWVKGVALFDPSSDARGTWNSWSMPCVVFVSRDEGRRWVDGWRNAVYLDDNHYFLRSLQRIQAELTALLGG